MADPPHDGDLVEVEPVTVIGQRMGELVDVPELVERMEAEDPHVQLAAGLVAKSPLRPHPELWRRNLPAPRTVSR